MATASFVKEAWFELELRKVGALGFHGLWVLPKLFMFNSCGFHVLRCVAVCEFGHF